MSELATRPAPVAATERILALDVLRGCAVLGILVMNVQGFALPFAAYSNLGVWEAPSRLDTWLWGVAHLFAEQKFMTLFSLLFGAGVALMLDRLERKELRAAAVHYRRTLGLLLIGLAHAYLLWYGDILVTYAICALALYPFRHVRPKRLLVTGLLVLCVAPVVSQGWGYHVRHLPEAERAEALAAMRPSEEQIAAEIEAYRGGWWGQMEHRAKTSLWLETLILAFFTLWRAGGLMLIGMAFYKWGVITAARSPAFYRRLALGGFGLGVPLVAFGMAYVLQHDFSFRATWLDGGLFNYFGSLGVSLGYIAVVMLWCLTVAPGPVTRSLAAVGRMALTNYLMQTILCVLIFYGYGLGLFAHLSRSALWLVVLAIWAFQMLVSPWWLARFRFGPFEWLWRTMTYRRLQPMRTGSA
jgi:uncharacterized protein